MWISASQPAKASSSCSYIAHVGLHEPQILVFLEAVRRRRAIDADDAVALAERLGRNRLPDTTASSGKGKFHGRMPYSA